jgi:hypothetical protein
VYSQKIRSYSFVTALLISGCVTASASVAVFTDRPTWLAATSSVNTIGFEGIAPANGFALYNGTAGNPDTLTIGSVSFQGFDHASPANDLEVNNQDPSWGTGAVLQGPPHYDLNSRIVATVGAGVFAVGSDVYNNAGGNPDSGTVNVVLSIDGTVYTVNTVAGLSGHAFIGFVSGSAITSISFFPESADQVVIDNFATGGQAGSQTPEAATMILCGSGLLLMVRRFRRNPKSGFVTAEARA